jgi:hypothetical protein
MMSFMTATSDGLGEPLGRPCTMTCRRVFATSIGLTHELANIAAEPPTTNGCTLLAKLVFSAEQAAGVAAGAGEGAGG